MSGEDKKAPTGLGFRRGLTNYGDPKFSIYLRRSFARSMGYSREMLDKPIVGICHSASGYNNCHRDMPALIAAGFLPADIRTSETTGYNYSITVSADKQRYSAAATPAEAREMLGLKGGDRVAF